MMNTATMAEIQSLGETIRGIKIAMMTTVCADGSLRSRPMATLDMEFDGTLWFFTRLDSSKVGEVADEGQVNLNFADPTEHRYVSLSGLATLSVDRQKIEELWSADVEPWFPEGIQDSQLALLRVDIDKWEYWDARSGVMVCCEGVLIEPATEFVQEVGDHLRVDLSGIWVTQDVGNSRMRNEGI